MKILITAPAWESYAEALRFLSGYMTARELEQWDARIWKDIRELARFPFGGQVEPYLEHLGGGHRRLVVGNFKVIYRVANDTVFITDIFDARQDPMRMKG